jgi:hypothetical protein
MSLNSSWLIWKFANGVKIVTVMDIISVSAIDQSFIIQWSGWACAG